ncbi:MAG: beta-lactamase domain protein [Frankiales bacterium]|nr:beta-lactamase domain protein [Frankiales bacterium]
MKLTVLGCAGTFPGPESPCSAYLVEHDGFRLALDLGSGSVGSLQRHGGVLDLDAIYITHVHGDHCLDLVPYSYARRYHPAGLPEPLPVHGPRGLAARVAQAYEQPPTNGLESVYAFAEHGPGELRIGPFAVTTAVMNHPVESHAVRVSAGGRTLVYSADTAACSALIDLARGADLFLCEASWVSDPVPPPDLHLTGREAGQHAALAGVARLLVTHVLPSQDAGAILAEARAAFGGPVDLAECGTTYDV